MIDNLYSEECEKQILSLLLCNPDTHPNILNKLYKEDFYSRTYRIIYSSIKDLFNSNKLIDIVSVSEYLKFKNELESIGGRQTINELALEYDSIKDINYLIKTLIKYSKKRQLYSLLDTAKDELDKNTDVDTLGVDVYNKVQDIINRKSETKFQSLSTGIVQLLDNVGYLMENNQSILGLSTGFISLDKTLNGLNPSRLYLIAARPSVGKGYGLDTLTLTPTGWVKNRDIKLGDIVIGRDGKPTKVIGIYPQPLQDCYKITLKDGREVICDAPHEWTVYSSKWGRERTFTAEELYQKLQCVRYKNRISLPRFTGDYGIKKNFIIPPYVMGVLIGDGCLTKGMCYCKPDTKIFEKVKSLLPNSNVHFNNDNTMVYITNFLSGLEYIREQGLNTQSYNKFIPKEYFHSSKEQRQELFLGLMDTDGYRFNTGWEYSTTSKQLAKDVQQLAWSLGYCAKIKERTGKYRAGDKIKETRINYRVFITTHNPITITKMEKVEPIPTQCIHVDNKDNLFVIEDYIVTHNSALVQQIAENVAKDKHVLFFSLEMGVEEYTQRSIYRRSGYNQSHLINNIISKEKILDAFTQAGAELDDLNLHIVDDSTCSLNIIERNINECIAKNGSCDLVVIDYLQLMNPADKYRKDDKDVATDNSKGLKRLARKYKIPIIALSQLSRNCEMRQDKRPQLSDLRDSGSLEQDADVVMFIYRSDIYEPKYAGTAEVIVAKNRQGERGKIINLAFNKGRVMFSELQERKV